MDQFLVGIIFGTMLSVFIAVGIGDDVSTETINTAQSICIPYGGLKYLTTRVPQGSVRVVCNNGVSIEWEQVYAN